MGKLSEEVKALRAAERAKKRALSRKKKRELVSVIHAQKIRKKQRCKRNRK